VLPQGMRNSPTICQNVIAQLLSAVRRAFPEVIIYHYMDDIPLAAKQDDVLISVKNSTLQVLENQGFEISPEKVQVTSPWRYLGWKISEKTIAPQRVSLSADVKTLNDLQSLLGSINWVRPNLGLLTDDLKHLFVLLKGDPDLTSPRSLTPPAYEALQIVQNKLASPNITRRWPDIPPVVVILRGRTQPFALLGQISSDNTVFNLWEYVFLPHNFSQTITSLSDMFAIVCNVIFLPLTNLALGNLLRCSLLFQTAVTDYVGVFSVHLPRVPLLQFLSSVQLYPDPLLSSSPLPGARTVFTDGSGKTRKAVVCWRTGTEWESDVHEVSGSPQVAELSAICRAFQLFPEPLNIVSDSLYVVGVVQRIERAYLKDISNETLARLFRTLLGEINSRKNKFFICHTRSHTHLPGPVSEGNSVADLLVSTIVLPNRVEQARLSHDFFHQGAKALRKSFGISHSQARAIVSACGECQQVTPLMPGRVNPRGLKPQQVWQMDVTHIPSFGKLKFVHVSIDTFSGLIVATAHSGEKTRDVKRHLSRAFATMGIPEKIKTDNGPAYTSASFKDFLSMWGIEHVTGIPHSPTGQAIVERAHQSLKNMLEKQ
ncbi:POK11 protein, partial [Furnarius figulus]|nr:POK11 protein [Furnarius figulus]